MIIFNRPSPLPGYNPGADLIKEVDEIFSAPPRLFPENTDESSDDFPLATPAPLPNTLPVGVYGEDEEEEQEHEELESEG